MYSGCDAVGVRNAFMISSDEPIVFTVTAAAALGENHVLLFTHNYDIHCIIYCVYMYMNIVCCLTVYTRDGGGLVYTLLLCSSPFPAPLTPTHQKPPDTTNPFTTTFSNALSHRFPVSCARTGLRRHDTTRRCIVSDKPPQTLWKTVSLVYIGVIL